MPTKIKTRPLCLAVLYSMVIFLSACQKQQPDPQNHQAQQTALEIIPEDIIQVRSGYLQQFTAFTGSIDSAQQTSIQAQITATVIQVKTDVGKTVKKGQILAILNSQDNTARLAQAQANLASAQAQAELNRSIMLRKQRLYQQGFIAQVEYLQSQVDYRTQQENVHAQQANVNIAQKAAQDTVIKSPFDGQISLKQIDIGQTIAAGQTIFEIVNPERLQIKATLSASEQQKIRIGQLIQFKIQGNSRQYQAKITRISPVSQTASRNFEFFAEPIQPLNTQSIGAFIEGQIIQDSPQQGLLIPTRAIQNLQEKPFVWVIRNQHLQKINISVLQIDAQQEQALISGLNDKDNVSLIKFNEQDQNRAVKIQS
ncbi:efflux RND transporter periplasmic adaptor subunit [Acinetobacter qingfengensis]|uniref:Efflux transporter periplasmic adaptor subunit n=1 Tax=Acinetobacter qingfengensis TaxID=1262585 RepID=A0A1E7RFB0_9GAMM|nr:efflux RND transporter periplasmic adaptor subunit [Acinetobacter qingfengensis]KAA8731866.1 efflux RND transporter periplasmic adaptor subunit [Acinetobacter qingfengensis]OEY98011.1 efflux transporter periplasmic adaptor subunit [Acinetobacter qingfengensis]